MPERRIIRGARIVPLDGRRSIKRGDVLIEDGVIAAIGGVRDQSNALIADTQSVIVPGFVQAQVHSEQTLLDRHFVPEPDPWRLREQLEAWSKQLDASGAEVLALATVARGLASGTVAFCEAGTSQFWSVMAEAARKLGARVTVAIDASAQDVSAELDAIETWLQSRDDLRDSVRLAIWAGDAERTPRARLRGAGALSRERSLPFVVRAGTMPGDRGGVERLDRLDLLSSRTLICHASGRALRRTSLHSTLADAGCSVVVSPGFSLLTGAPMPPLGALLDAGVNLALGSVSGASRMGLDIFKELRLLARHLRGAVDEPASAALEIAARGGATALGLDVGTVEVGRAADLIAVDVLVDEDADHETLCRLLIERGGPDYVRTVWVGGDVVVSDGRLVRSDPPDAAAEESLRGRAGFWAARQERRWLADLRSAIGRRWS